MHGSSRRPLTARLLGMTLLVALTTLSATPPAAAEAQLPPGYGVLTVPICLWGQRVGWLHWQFLPGQYAVAYEMPGFVCQADGSNCGWAVVQDTSDPANPQTRPYEFCTPSVGSSSCQSSIFSDGPGPRKAAAVIGTPYGNAIGDSGAPNAC
jgi:hypothetical protein